MSLWAKATRKPEVLSFGFRQRRLRTNPDRDNRSGKFEAPARGKNEITRDAVTSNIVDLNRGGRSVVAGQ